MLFVIIPLALVLLALILYFALSKKSSPMVRLTALVAIGTIILAVLVCLIIIVTGLESGGSKAGASVELLAEEPAAPANDNFSMIIALAVFILAMLGTIIILSNREKRRKEQAELRLSKELKKRS